MHGIEINGEKIAMRTPNIPLKEIMSKIHMRPLTKKHNLFGALNYEIECYKCKKFGPTTINCRSKFIGSSGPWKETRQTPKQQTIWKKKQEDL